MDLLIKNNIMKRNKIIVDVGTHTTKILDVHYASKEIYIKEIMMNHFNMSCLN